jgi:hypothetical protein
VAQYILTLANYNLQVQHHPGTLNRADTLSRCPDYDDRKEDNKEVTPLPSELFNTKLQSISLCHNITIHQQLSTNWLQAMKETHGLEQEQDTWKKDGKIVILSEEVQ